MANSRKHPFYCFSASYGHFLNVGFWHPRGNEIGGGSFFRLMARKYPIARSCEHGTCRRGPMFFSLCEEVQSSLKGCNRYCNVVWTTFTSGICWFQLSGIDSKMRRNSTSSPGLIGAEATGSVST